ncbi:unnamed protein product [Urochloa humidicola]
MGPGGARRGRGRGKNRISCGEDRISGLPDHLLHSILLPAAPDHRHPHQRPVAPLALVWAHLPALSFNEWVHHHQQRHCIYDGIDAALAAYAAPALGRLEIVLNPEPFCWSAADRFGPWLQFAARRLSGELKFVFVFSSPGSWTLKEAKLPVCERATAIDLGLPHHALRLPAPPAAAGGGTFAALRVLSITCKSLVATELEHVVAGAGA